MNSDTDMAAQLRRPKTVTPDAAKDDKYWERRNRNNITAKRSREKKRHNDDMLRKYVEELRSENEILRWELYLLKSRFGLLGKKGSFDSASMDESEPIREGRLNSTTDCLSPIGKRLPTQIGGKSVDRTFYKSFLSDFYNEYIPASIEDDIKQNRFKSDQDNVFSTKSEESYILKLDHREDPEDQFYEPVDLSLKRRRMCLGDSGRFRSNSNMSENKNDDVYICRQETAM